MDNKCYAFTLKPGFEGHVPERLVEVPLRYHDVEATRIRDYRTKSAFNWPLYPVPAAAGTEFKQDYLYKDLVQLAKHSNYEMPVEGWKKTARERYDDRRMWLVGAANRFNYRLTEIIMGDITSLTGMYLTLFKLAREVGPFMVINRTRDVVVVPSGTVKRKLGLHYNRGMLMTAFDIWQDGVPHVVIDFREAAGASQDSPKYWEVPADRSLFRLDIRSRGSSTLSFKPCSKAPEVELEIVWLGPADNSPVSGVVDPALSFATQFCPIPEAAFAIVHRVTSYGEAVRFVRWGIKWIKILIETKSDPSIVAKASRKIQSVQLLLKGRTQVVDPAERPPITVSSFLTKFDFWFGKLRISNITPAMVILVRTDGADRALGPFDRVYVQDFRNEVLRYAEAHNQITGKVYRLTEERCVHSVIDNRIELLFDLPDNCAVILRIKWVGPVCKGGESDPEPDRHMFMDEDLERAQALFVSEFEPRLRFPPRRVEE